MSMWTECSLRLPFSKPKSEPTMSNVCVGCDTKRTSGFCFVHRDPVCDQCLLNVSFPDYARPASPSSIHKSADNPLRGQRRARKKNKKTLQCVANCVVSEYRQFLSDPDHQYPPRCPLRGCFKPVDPRECFRLPCRCTFHPSCLSKVLGATMTDTPRAVVACPSCSEQVWPASGPFAAPLAQFLRDTGIGSVASPPSFTSSWDPPLPSAVQRSKKYSDLAGDDVGIDILVPPSKHSAPNSTKPRKICTLSRVIFGALLTSTVFMGASYAVLIGGLA
jgi:hypothetical protein